MYIKQLEDIFCKTESDGQFLALFVAGLRRDPGPVMVVTCVITRRSGGTYDSKQTSKTTIPIKACFQTDECVHLNDDNVIHLFNFTSFPIVILCNIF